MRSATHLAAGSAAATAAARQASTVAAVAAPAAAATTNGSPASNGVAPLAGSPSVVHPRDVALLVRAYLAAEFPNVVKLFTIECTQTLTGVTKEDLQKRPPMQLQQILSEYAQLKAEKRAHAQLRSAMQNYARVMDTPDAMTKAMEQWIGLVGDYSQHRQACEADPEAGSARMLVQSVQNRFARPSVAAAVRAANKTTAAGAAGDVAPSIVAATSSVLPPSSKRSRKAEPKRIVPTVVPASESTTTRAEFGAPAAAAASQHSQPQHSVESSMNGSHQHQPLDASSSSSHGLEPWLSFPAPSSPYHLPSSIAIRDGKQARFEFDPEGFRALAGEYEGGEGADVVVTTGGAPAGGGEGNLSFAEQLARLINQQSGNGMELDLNMLSLPAASPPPPAAAAGSSAAADHGAASAAFRLSDAALSDIAERCLNDDETKRFIDQAVVVWEMDPSKGGSEFLSPSDTMTPMDTEPGTPFTTGATAAASPNKSALGSAQQQQHSTPRKSPSTASLPTRASPRAPAAATVASPGRRPQQVAAARSTSHARSPNKKRKAAAETTVTAAASGEASEDSLDKDLLQALNS